MKSEKGQALILIAFSIVAMLGLTALALDGGNAFADRRHAQNTADASALAAALYKIQTPSSSYSDLEKVVWHRAASNGYTIQENITLHVPPVDGPYAGNAQYLQVKIVSPVETWFAQTVGVAMITNRVEAVARAKPLTPFYDGHSVVALSPGDGKNNTPEMKFYGSAVEVAVSGSGVFANSSDKCAVDTSGGPDLSVPYINSPGTICGVSGIKTGSGVQYPFPPDHSYLADLCKRANAVKINGDFPGKGAIEDNKIYCISGDFKITGGDYIASNVTFVVDGGVSISGNGNLQLTSAPSLPLFYLPYAANKVDNNKYTVTINGNSNMKLTGQLLAPASHCKINGTGATNPMKGQVICYTVEMGGNADAIVIYQDSDNMDEPPQIELTQ